MTTPIRPLIAGNWKMNGLRADAAGLAAALAAAVPADGGGEMLVCPPFPWLAEVGAALDGSAVALGAQDCHVAPKGAHTGDVSAAMIADAGCAYVIVGHSERRADHGEASTLVEAKAGAVHQAGLVAIVCVGETEAERDAGQALEVVGRQLAASMPAGATAANTVVAYEPVWAIGTGRTPQSADIVEMHGHMRARLAAAFGGQGQAMRLLYGGSVKPDNAAEILALADVNGALVGGASLKADDFVAIFRACS